MILEKIFKLKENNTTIATEAIAGTTTFLTMSYIIFVQPAVLSSCGMDFGSVMVATCIASAVACLITAFLANYPIAQAPAMGHNFYFAFTVCGPIVAGGMGYPLAGGSRCKSYIWHIVRHIVILWVTRVNNIHNT